MGGTQARWRTGDAMIPISRANAAMTNPTYPHRTTRSLRVIQSSLVVATGKTVAVNISLAK